MGILLAILFWLFFSLFGKILVDQENTEKFLKEQDWLKFIKSNIRQVIINRYGNFLLGVLIAIAGYKMFSKAASWLVKKYFTSKTPFELFFVSAFPSLPSAEFIYLIPAISYGCTMVLKNKSESLKITRIEVEPRVSKDIIVDHQDRKHIILGLEFLHFEAQEFDEGSGKALRWEEGRGGIFKMDAPFRLEAGEEIQLPAIYPVADEKDIPSLEDHMNNMTMEIEFSIALNIDDNRTSTTIKAPLRILVWDDETMSIKGIAEMPAGSKNSKQDYLNFEKDIRDNDQEPRQIALQIATREFQLEDIRDIKKKLIEEPANPELNFQLAGLLRETMQYEESMKYMNKAFELGLDTPEFHYERIQTGFLTGTLEGIKDSAERLLALRPGDAEAHVLMGQQLSIENKPKEALQYFDAAIQLDKNSATAAYWKSRILNEFENYEEGLAWLNRSIELDPEQRDAYMDRAITFFNLGKEDSAFESIKQAFDKGFRDMEQLENIGGTLEGNTKREFDILIGALKKKYGNTGS